MSTDETQHKVLFVDDEPEILSGIKAALRRAFEMDCAASPAGALERVRRYGPYAVVVSDLRMPEMDGTEFLSEVRKISPDSVRILLTGHGDLDAAVSAVNDGQIFRFLTKPCPPPTLKSTVEAGIRQYQLITAERELLQSTLRRSVETLTDVLGLVNPSAFSCASRVKEIVRHLCDQLMLPDKWQYELAAMLSQLGCVTLPSETLDKLYTGDELTTAEEEAFRDHPRLGHDLIARIPRLEVVAKMVQMQNDQVKPGSQSGVATSWDPAVLGGQLLRAAMLYDRLLNDGHTAESALQAFREAKYGFPLFLLEALDGYILREGEMVTASVEVDQLIIGMVLKDDVQSKTGVVVAAKGCTVSATVLQRMRNYARGLGIVEPIHVLVDRRLLPSV